MTKLVYFAHGKESGPWGTKIQHLSSVAKNHGFEVESPDYSFTMDQEERVEVLLSLNPEADILVLVGSSMGGYVSAVASQNIKPDGLFLMAPAFYVPDYAHQSPKPYARYAVIMHGRDDDIVPVNHSQRYAGDHDVDLRILQSGHRLTDVLPEITKAFDELLNIVQKG